MKKLLLPILMFAFINSYCQKFDTLSTFPAPDFSGCPKRIGVDSSKWNLYKIDSGYYHYFKLISYGLEWPSGWSDAVGYMEKRYLKDTYLHFDCKITDTVPIVMRVSSYDDEKKMRKEYNEYRVGGIFGEFLRYGEVVYTKE